MAVKNASEIDKNFRIETSVAKEGLRYHGAEALDV